MIKSASGSMIPEITTLSALGLKKTPIMMFWSAIVVETEKYGMEHLVSIIIHKTGREEKVPTGTMEDCVSVTNHVSERRSYGKG
jgi:hypothetical protein